MSGRERAIKPCRVLLSTISMTVDKGGNAVVDRGDVVERSGDGKDDPVVTDALTSGERLHEAPVGWVGEGKGECIAVATL